LVTDCRLAKWSATPEISISLARGPRIDCPRVVFRRGSAYIRSQPRIACRQENRMMTERLTALLVLAALGPAGASAQMAAQPTPPSEEGKTCRKVAAPGGQRSRVTCLTAAEWRHVDARSRRGEVLSRGPNRPGRPVLY
jgi:hypothetical protein